MAFFHKQLNFNFLTSNVKGVQSFKKSSCNYLNALKLKYVPKVFYFSKKDIPLLNLKNNGQTNLTLTYTTLMERLIFVEYSVDSPLQIFITPTKGSFPPLNNNFHVITQ